MVSKVTHTSGFTLSIGDENLICWWDPEVMSWAWKSDEWPDIARARACYSSREKVFAAMVEYTMFGR